MNHLIKRLSSFALVALFVVFLIPAPQQVLPILLILTFCVILDGMAVMRGINKEYYPVDDRDREELNLGQNSIRWMMIRLWSFTKK